MSAVQPSEPSGPVLLWPGKKARVCRAVSPLRLLERFSAKADTAGDRPEATARGHAPASPGLPNLLIRGDNSFALSSLLHGPLRAAIAAQGGIKLVYCDPPFAVGTAFTMHPAQAPARAGSARPADDAPSLAREPGTAGAYSAGSESAKAGSGYPAAPSAKQGGRSQQPLAYTDTWEGGLSGFLDMAYACLLQIRELLAPDGSLFWHCDWRTAPHIRILLDEIFGPERFLGDIVWHYTGGGRSRRWFSRKHDRILHYAASARWTFNVDAVRVPYKKSSGYARNGITSAAGKHYRPNPEGTPVDDVWDIPIINPMAAERTGYPTQKPERLLERILSVASNPGDLVADFFSGSGTTALVAGRLGRSWIAVDQSALAVHCARKRLLAAQSNKGAALAFTVAALGEVDACRARTGEALPHAVGAGAHQAAAPDLPDLPASQPARQTDGLPAWRWHRHEAAFPGGSLAYAVAAPKVKALCREGGLAFLLEGFQVLELGGAPPAGHGQAGAGAESAGKRELPRPALPCWRELLDYWSLGLAPAPLPADQAAARQLHRAELFFEAAAHGCQGKDAAATSAGSVRPGPAARAKAGKQPAPLACDPARASFGSVLPPGCEADPLFCTVLWHSFGRPKDRELACLSPVMAPGGPLFSGSRPDCGADFAGPDPGPGMWGNSAATRLVLCIVDIFGHES
ncbi:site-specific DNA-methyltransferase, partial [Desulfovibrio sp. OttesenSCG-928-A18]|nr:site-specific DNA-methyltransferase [Desulfovibrio sp. OttesenSCG-928-A18]